MGYASVLKVLVHSGVMNALAQPAELKRLSVPSLWNT